jgi:uncharacterized protein (DUF427 family)
MERVWDYPRPPALAPVGKEVEIRFGGRVIARTDLAWRVMETSHPPVYYLPPEAFAPGVLVPSGGQGSFCEWKGVAAYWDVVAAGKRAARAGWSYPEPTARFESIRDYVAVYAGPMEACLVGGEVVTPQPGGFYGGWITKDLVGPFKGAPGSAGW